MKATYVGSEISKFFEILRREILNFSNYKLFLFGRSVFHSGKHLSICTSQSSGVLFFIISLLPVNIINCEIFF